jgi:guanylate kinase
MIILISGPINSGKTTVGKALAALLPRTAHLEVDTLRELVHFLPFEAAIPINLENAAAITSNLARRGIGVILTYPLGEEDYDYLLRAFADLPTAIHTFILGPTLETALVDRGERRLSDHERRRIREQYQDNRHQPAFGIQIDNTAQAPEETATMIVQRIRASRNTRGHWAANFPPSGRAW